MDSFKLLLLFELQLLLHL